MTRRRPRSGRGHASRHCRWSTRGGPGGLGGRQPRRGRAGARPAPGRPGRSPARSRGRASRRGQAPGGIGGRTSDYCSSNLNTTENTALGSVTSLVPAYPLRQSWVSAEENADVSEQTRSKRSARAVPVVRQDQPAALCHARLRGALRRLPDTVIGARRAGRGVRCRDVRCLDCLVVPSGRRRLLGAVVRAVPDDGARAREGGERGGGPMDHRESGYRRGPGAWRTLPDPLDSDARDLPGRPPASQRRGRTIRRGYTFARDGEPPPQLRRVGRVNRAARETLSRSPLRPDAPRPPPRSSRAYRLRRSSIVRRSSAVASAPRTTMANVLLNPSGGSTLRPARPYASRTAVKAASGSLTIGCFRIAASAVPVYST